MTPQIKDAFLISNENCISQKDHEVLNEAVVLMAAIDCRPFSLTFGTGFQNFAQKLFDLEAKYGKKYRCQNGIFGSTTLRKTP